MSNRLLTSRALLKWCRGSAGYAGLRSPDVTDLAMRTWAQFKAGRRPSLCTIPIESTADFGYCLGRLIAYDLETTSAAGAQAFEFLSSLEWDSTDFLERSDVLADIAYTNSVRFRASTDYPEMRKWEDECVSLLAATEPSATYLRNRKDRGGTRADEQFLARPAVVLAVCRQLERDRNYNPRQAALQAASAFRVVELRDATVEELNYVRGSLALSAAISNGMLGDFASSSRWIEAAKRSFLLTNHPAAMLIEVSTAELISRHVQHYCREVLSVIDPIIDQARKLGVARQLLTLRVLKAHVLKDLGMSEEARTNYQVIDAENPTGDPMILAVNLVGLAEVQHALGDLAGAEETCRRAFDLAAESNAPLSWGFLHSLRGQILRDSGRHDEALRALDSGIRAYASGGMIHLQCYLTIVSAEILLGSGRTREGIARLLQAIAMLKKTRVENEIIAAVELLRMAVNSGLAPSTQAIRELGLIIAKLRR